MNDSVWTFEELSRDCDGHYCMADGKDYPALCRYEENMTGHPLGDVCGADCMGECSERFCPSEALRRLIGKTKPMQLRNRRNALGLTLEEVARRAGLSKGFLSTVENGKVGLGLDTAVRLAKALRVSLEELSGMVRNENKQKRQDDANYLATLAEANGPRREGACERVCRTSRKKSVCPTSAL